MINWNTDEKQMKKDDPKGYKVWRMVQLINYGLDGEKIDLKFLMSNWENMKDKITHAKRKTIEWLVWNTPWMNRSV